MTPEQFDKLCKRIDAQTEAIVTAVIKTQFSSPYDITKNIMDDYHNKIGDTK